jgi:hypothetical protein
MAVEKWRKKPVVIEAFLLTQENVQDAMSFVGSPCLNITQTLDDGLVISTLEGNHLARYGDYIIKGVHGEFYPCKPDIFVKTYELVE